MRLLNIPREKKFCKKIISNNCTWKFAWQRCITGIIIIALFRSLFWKGGSTWHIAYHLLTNLFSTPPSIKSLYCNNLYVLFFYSLFFSMSAICTEFSMSIPVPTVSFCTIRFLYYIVQSFIPIATVQQIISLFVFRITPQNHLFLIYTQKRAAKPITHYFQEVFWWIRTNWSSRPFKTERLPETRVYR